MLSDAARAVIEQREKERMERIDGTRPMFDTALTKGDFRLAEPGAECWAKTDCDNIADIRLNHDGEARGGIILEITTDPDPDTGELRRAYRTYDYTAPAHRAITVLTEAMVDPDSFEAPNMARIRRVYRRICKDIGQRTSLASPAELDMVRTAFLLSTIVGRVAA